MFWKASIWQQDTYVKQQKLDLKDRRYLVTYIACLQKSSWASILANSPFCFSINNGQCEIKHVGYLGAAGPPSPQHTHTAKTMQGPSHTGSQQQQSNPVQCIHQQCTFIYLMAESMMALKEISAIFSLGVVSHLFVDPQQLPQLQLSGS